MKVLFVIESLAVGGAEKSLVTLLNNLHLPDTEIDLLLFSTESAFEKYLPEHINIIRILPNYSFRRRLKFLLCRKISNKKQTHNIFWNIFADELGAVAQQYNVAVAYGQGFPTYFVAEKVHAHRKLAWVNTDYAKAGYEMMADYPFYKKFDKMVAVSPQVKAGIETELHKLRKIHDVAVITDITDKSLIIEMADEETHVIMDASKWKILTVCRLVKLKGLHLAIGAAKILKSKGVEFNWYIIGEGERRSYLQRLITQFGLEAQVHLLGEFTNPYPYMKACDVYVQTSLFEGLGLTVIEAACLNKPIVSTNFPTVYGILKEGETGLIAEMNAESIAENIQRLIDDTQLRERLVDNLESQKNSDKEETLSKIENLLTR